MLGCPTFPELLKKDIYLPVLFFLAGFWLNPVSSEWREIKQVATSRLPSPPTTNKCARGSQQPSSPPGSAIISTKCSATRARTDEWTGGIASHEARSKVWFGPDCAKRDERPRRSTDPCKVGWG